MAVKELYRAAAMIEKQIRDLERKQRTLLRSHENICKAIVEEERKLGTKTKR